MHCDTVPKYLVYWLPFLKISGFQKIQNSRALKLIFFVQNPNLINIHHATHCCNKTLVTLFIMEHGSYYLQRIAIYKKYLHSSLDVGAVVFKAKLSATFHSPEKVSQDRSGWWWLTAGTLSWKRFRTCCGRSCTLVLKHLKHGGFGVNHVDNNINYYALCLYTISRGRHFNTLGIWQFPVGQKKCLLRAHF